MTTSPISTSDALEPMAGRRSRSSRRVRRSRLLVLLVSSALLLLAGRAMAEEPVAYPDRFQVGQARQDPDAELTTLIDIGSRTYNGAAAALAAADDDVPVRLPLTRVQPSNFDIADASVNVTDALVITVRGTSTNTGTLLDGVETDVLVTYAWNDTDTDQLPAITVSYKAAPQVSGFTLGSLLGIEGPAAGLRIDPVVLTTGAGDAYDPGETDAGIRSAHLSRLGNLTPDARAYFSDVYGPDLPDPVPALAEIGRQTTLAATIGLHDDFFSGVVGEALSLPKIDDRVVLQGGLGYDLHRADSFKPKADAWSLGVTLPRTDAVPAGLEGLLGTDGPETEWQLGLGYRSGGADGTTGKFTAIATGALYTDLLSNSDEFDRFQASLSIEVGTPKPGEVHGTRTVSFTALYDGEWDDPFAMSWLPTVTDVKVTGSVASDGQGSVSFKGALSGTVYIESLDASVSLTIGGSFASGAFDVTATVQLDGEVSVGELASLFTGDLTVLPDVVSSVTLADAGLQVRVGRTPHVPPSPDGTSPTNTTPNTKKYDFTFRVAASGTVGIDLLGNGDPFEVTLLLIADDKGVTIGARPDSRISLSTILPGADIPDELDFVLSDADANAAFGAVVSTTKRPIGNVTLRDYPVAVADFFRPLLGLTETSVVTYDVPAGIGVLGTFRLPEGLASVVSKLGADSKVTFAGSLPLFGVPAVDLRIGLSLAVEGGIVPDEISDFIESIDASLHLTGDVGGVSLEAKGAVTLRLPAGIPTDHRTPQEIQRLLALVPAPIWDDVAHEDDCPTGSKLRPSFAAGIDPATGTHLQRCYDLFTLQLASAVTFDRSTISMRATGTIKPVGQEYLHPFGIEWFGFGQVTIGLDIGYDLVTQTADVDFGFTGSGRVVLESAGWSKDIFTSVAARVQVNVASSVPVFSIVPEGFSFSSKSGVGTADLRLLYNGLKSAFASLPEADIPDFPVDVNLRNMTFSLALLPNGVPRFCIPPGLTIGGDLYFGGDIDDVADNTISCTTQTATPPDPDQSTCAGAQFEGCMASIRLTVSPTGIFGEAKRGEISLADVVTFDDTRFAFALTPSSQFLTFHTGGSINLPTDTDVSLVDAEFRGRFTPFGTKIYGTAELADGRIKGLLDAEVQANPFTDQSIRFDLALTGDLDEFYGGSDVEQLLIAPVTQVVATPLQLVKVVDRVLARYEETGKVKKAIKEIIPAFESAGIDPPRSFERLIDGLEAFFDLIEPVEKLIDDTVNKFLNGMKVNILGIKVAWGGVCDLIFPHDEFPLLRKDGDPDKKCKKDNLIPAIIEPLATKAISEITGTDVTLAQMRAAIRDLQLDGPALDDVCLVASIDASIREKRLDISAQASALFYGTPVGIGFDLEAGDLIGLGSGIAGGDLKPKAVTKMAGSFLDSLFSAGTVAPHRLCDQANRTELVDVVTEEVLPDPPTPVNLASIDVPATIDEGEMLTITGTFDSIIEESRVLHVEWGFDSDGEGTDDILAYAIPAGSDSFTLSHLYTDDDPTGSSSDRVVVRVSDRTGIENADDYFVQLSGTTTGQNVAPTDIVLERLDPSGTWRPVGGTDAIEEGGSADFRVSFSDVGLSDDADVVIDWGDGEADQLAVPADANGALVRTIEVSHQWRDDNPTGSPVDLTTISVGVFDDDTGLADATAPMRVVNVAPRDLAISDATAVATFVDGHLAEADRPAPTTVIREGDLYEFEFRFGDLLLDSHELVVDWGDGSQTVVPTESITVFDDDGNEVGEVWDVLSSAFTRLDGIEDQEFTVDTDTDYDTLIAAVAELDTPIVADRIVTLRHRWDDENPTGTPSDAYTVTMKIVDDDTAVSTVQRTLTVHDIAPEVVREGWDGPGQDRADRFDLPRPRIDEHGTAVIDVEVADPSRADTQSVVVDWGDGTATSHPLGAAPTPSTILAFTDNYVPRPLQVSHQYGDDGVYTVVFTVTDDDGRSSQSTTYVTVDNVDPTLVLDRTDTVPTTSGPTFTTRIGIDNSFRATSTDLGSEDLTFDWQFGDGGTDIETHQRTDRPDGHPSPDVDPVDVTDTATHRYPQPCLYTMTVDVSDDDGGSGPQETAPVVAVGDEKRHQTEGWWGAAYGNAAEGRAQHRSLAESQCLLDIAAHMSSILGEMLDSATFSDAYALLQPDDQSARNRLHAEILTAWLNYGIGAIGVTPEGRIDSGFQALLGEIEAIAMDESADDDAMRDAERRLEHAQRDASAG